MTDFEYSGEALEALNFFYECDLTMYVEGKDDVTFWSTFTSLFSTEIMIKKTGGKKELHKLIQRVIDENLKILVAIDRDYSDFINDVYNHPRILYTYGHSIENSIFCTQSIQNIIEKSTRQNKSFYDIIFHWQRKLCNDAYWLIIYDISNNKYNKGFNIIPDKCNRFLKSSHSPYLSKDLIHRYLDHYKSSFSEEEISDVINQIENSPYSLYHTIKGSFLYNSVLNLIKKVCYIYSQKTISLSIDSLFISAVDDCKKPCSSCEEKQHYINIIHDAIVNSSSP